MQSRGSGEREKEEEGNLETKPIHHTSGQSAKRQLPQHLQGRQETVVGRLKDRGRRKEKSNDEKRQLEAEVKEREGQTGRRECRTIKAHCKCESSVMGK